MVNDNNIVSLEDFRKSREVDYEIDFSNVDPEKLMRLYEDIMNTNPDTVERDIEHTTIEFTRFVIARLYDIGADPEDPTLSDNMIYITMLFTAALTEYFTGTYEESNGNENILYKYLNDMREGSKK